MKVSLAKWIGITAVLVGAICTWEAVLRPFFESIFEGTPRFFPVAFSLLMFAPYYLAVYFGFKTIHQPNKENIAHALGMSLAMAVIYGASEFSSAFDGIGGKRAGFSFGLLISTCLAIPVYVWLAKAALRSESIEYAGRQDLFGKAFIVVFALITWSCSDNLFELFYPEERLADPFTLTSDLSFFIPILVGILSYKIFATVVGIIPLDTNQFFSPLFTLLIAGAVWSTTMGLWNPAFPDRPDDRVVAGAFAAAGCVYLLLRIIARSFGKTPQPVGPKQA